MPLTTKKMDWNNWNSGRMEYWKGGDFGRAFSFIIPIFHHSSVPTFSPVLWLAHYLKPDT